MGEQVAKVMLALPGVIWAVLACYIVYLLRGNIEDSVARLTGFEAFGLKVTMGGALSALTAAVEMAAKNPGWPVEVPEADRVRAIERARKERGLLASAEILWVDDHPANNRNEVRMLQSLGALATFAATTDDAVLALQQGVAQSRPFHLIVSDISRDLPKPDPVAGLGMLARLQQEKVALPVIFYVGHFEPEKGVPPGAFGITNRPDQLLHLILDALSRSRGGA